MPDLYSSLNLRRLNLNTIMKNFIVVIIATLTYNVAAIGQKLEVETPSVFKNSLVLKNTSFFSDSDNGVIYSDPDISSSDIIISANDGIAFDIGNEDPDAEFSIFYNDNVIHNVNKDGDTDISGNLRLDRQAVC